MRLGRITTIDRFSQGSRRGNARDHYRPPTGLVTCLPGRARAGPGGASVPRRRWANGPALAEEAGPDAATALERDPRYVICRLQQALSTLLAVDLPPIDGQT